MLEESTVQTLDQRRAKHAWDAIQCFSTSKANNEADDYAREAKKLPVRIMTAGLGQALAFILAKATRSKKSLKQLHEDLSEWVLKERGLDGANSEHLLESVISGDSDFLRRATDEALAYLQWLNRFAEAEGLTEGDES